MAKEIGNKRLITDILNDLFMMKWLQDDWASSLKYAEQRLAIAQELNDKTCICSSLSQMGNSFFTGGDIKKARVYFEQALDMARQENSPNMVCWVLDYLGRLEHQEGNIDKSIEYFTEGIQVYRQLKIKGNLASACLRFGSVLLQQGCIVKANELFEESLCMAREVKKIEEGVGMYYLLGMSGIAALSGQYLYAAQLVGTIEAEEEKSKNFRNEFYHCVYDPLIANVREQLGETNFNAALAEGRELTLEQAIELTHH
jgi:tetratricopeptide (TPR) repeat protein